jgi:LDH2 family malate/lactate/ureidoglycolate dehydrogenase
MSTQGGPGSLSATTPLAHDLFGISLAVGSSNHLPPWGGRDMLLGTNPIAIAVPAMEEAPVVLDMAPTVAAYGKVRLKQQRGEPMPVGWMIDQEGRPLTDAARADDGYLLPIGEYKGYGLAMMIGLLSGLLNRAAFGRDVIDFAKDPKSIANTGHAILALRVDTFAPVAEFRRSVDAVVREMRGSARLPGVERIFVPGEQSHLRMRDRIGNGVPMPPALRRALNEMAASLGIDPLPEGHGQ